MRNEPGVGVGSGEEDLMSTSRVGFLEKERRGNKARSNVRMMQKENERRKQPAESRSTQTTTGKWTRKKQSAREQWARKTTLSEGVRNLTKTLRRQEEARSGKWNNSLDQFRMCSAKVGSISTTLGTNQRKSLRGPSERSELNEECTCISGGE